MLLKCLRGYFAYFEIFVVLYCFDCNRRIVLRGERERGNLQYYSFIVFSFQPLHNDYLKKEVDLEDVM